MTGSKRRRLAIQKSQNKTRMDNPPSGVLSARGFR